MSSGAKSRGRRAMHQHLTELPEAECAHEDLGGAPDAGRQDDAAARAGDRAVAELHAGRARARRVLHDLDALERRDRELRCTFVHEIAPHGRLVQAGGHRAEHGARGRRGARRHACLTAVKGQNLHALGHGRVQVCTQLWFVASLPSNARAQSAIAYTG
eukprot:6214523-Pleurochrysis_carterae.AAC.2